MSSNDLMTTIAELQTQLSVALEKGDIEKATAVAQVASLLPKEDVNRALNPIDPEIKQAGIEYWKEMVLEFPSSSEFENVVIQTKVLFLSLQLTKEEIKAVIKPIALLFFKQKMYLKGIADFAKAFGEYF